MAELIGRMLIWDSETGTIVSGPCYLVRELEDQSHLPDGTDYIEVDDVYYKIIGQVNL